MCQPHPQALLNLAKAAKLGGGGGGGGMDALQIARPFSHKITTMQQSLTKLGMLMPCAVRATLLRCVSTDVDPITPVVHLERSPDASTSK